MRIWNIVILLPLAVRPPAMTQGNGSKQRANAYSILIADPKATLTQVKTRLQRAG
jgi:hypothetical protein